MMLIKTERTYPLFDTTVEIPYYAAWLEWIDDEALREAMLAANINMLRRHAPYAYFFAGLFTAEEWSRIGDALDYRKTLDVRDLRRGVWFSYPTFDEPTTTVVTAIERGDILPFVHFLNEEFYTLLCLPSPLSLEEMDRLIFEASSNVEALRQLLSTGGCLVSVIDYEDFKVQTFNEVYGQYFGV